MTRLAVSITVRSLEQALGDVSRAAARGADLVEYRIDRFTDGPVQLLELVQRSALPCLITCRPTWEGGLYDGPESRRMDLWQALLTAATPPAYLDVEWQAYERSEVLRARIGRWFSRSEGPQPAACRLILSSHDFDRRPSDLNARVRAMAAVPACSIVKTAWRARSLADNLCAFDVLRQSPKPAVALCMGEHGLPSRVLARKYGAYLTFAALDPDHATAPGQPTVGQLKGLYRWDALGADTRIYGVIGDPVGHSMSPAVHNAGFDAIGYDGIYLPLPIPAGYEAFRDTVRAWLDRSDLHFRGASVTIPHKQNLLRFVREQGGSVEPLADRIGAANTLTVQDDGSRCVVNTDYAAALDAVCHSLGISRPQLRGVPVAVIGAGGVARAIVAAFAQYGATVVVYNRTFEHARALAERFDPNTGASCTTGRLDLPGKVVAAPLDKLCGSCCRVWINATPIGMHPHTDAWPIPGFDLPEHWGPDTVVFDTIYNPQATRLLRRAREAGCRIITGRDMFVRQAAAQFQLWTGRPAPAGLFARVLAQQLG